MIDDNNLAQSLLVNKEDFRKTMETNARFQELMMMYRCAIREIQTKLEILNDEFKTKNQRNPIDSIRTRVKSPASIFDKMQRKGCLLYTSYQENTKLLTVCKWIADLLIVILLAYTLTLFLCDRTTISGNSMQPAIENEDTVLLNRIAYSFHGPKRYSIIAFHPNGVKTSKIYVKRVIGLPGETIQIHDGKVYINGSVLEDDVSEDDILTAGLAAGELTLGENE